MMRCDPRMKGCWVTTFQGSICPAQGRARSHEGEGPSFF